MPKTLTRVLVTNVATFGLIFVLGCSSNVILVPEGTPVQLAESVQARVFVVQKDGTKVKSNGRVRLPAGAWVATLPEDDADTGLPNALGTSSGVAP
jgi:hypothetical protein